MPEKLNLFKSCKADFVARKTPAIVNLSSTPYLAIKGKGAPQSEPFIHAVEALYALAFGVKMDSKQAGRDFTVCKLQGQWWSEWQENNLVKVPREQWQWRLLIRQPVWIDREAVNEARLRSLEKGKSELVKDVALIDLDEGTVVQALHTGPYDQEEPLILQMHAFAEQQGYHIHGLHHEIYLSDPRRTAPEKLRTILRHPVKLTR